MTSLVAHITKFYARLAQIEPSHFCHQRSDRFVLTSVSTMGRELTNCQDERQSALGQLEKSDIPHAISVVGLIADIFCFIKG